MLGQEPTGEPVAEMWIGAHPGDPSVLEDGRRLDDAIAADPETMLGTSVTARFGPRLPFLMKLLAAGEPLSLQVHPTSERARIRFAEQEAAGIPLSAPGRSYQDASHKPELIYALTRFEGMAGFRAPEKSAVILRGLGLPWLDVIADRLESTQTPFQELRAIVTELLATPEPKLGHRLGQLRVAASAAEQRMHVSTAGRRDTSPDPSAVERESIRVYAALVPLIDRYPNDAGVLVTLLLNHVVLAAGEAMFIDAGVIHAYTSGFGVEIMAASDNVLRAGLTPKHVDIPELLEITNFTPMPPPLWASNRTPDGHCAFSPPVAEFELLVCPVGPDPVEVDAISPVVVLCTDGSIRADRGEDTVALTSGQSAFVDSGAHPLRLNGNGQASIARLPL